MSFEWFDFKCPFCGRKIGADPDLGLIGHALPQCREFNLDEDSLAFLRRVRRERERLGLMLVEESEN